MGGPSTTFVHDTPRPLSLVSSNNHLLCFCLDLSLSRTPHSLLPYLTFFAVYLLNLLIMHASLIALAASLSVASAVTRGFNYGAVTREGAMKNEAAFTAEFNAAKGLANTDGAFSSARLYTMIQSGTDNSPISAIPAAIATDTKLFLGLWASAGQTIIDNEIAALTSAIEQYGEEFTSRVNGISVGSEDLYRISPTGLKNDPTGVGAGPAQIVSYIQQVRKALSGTALAKVAVGHVDTWDVWRNGSNSAVIDEADFLGMNTFPYFQVTEDNSIENAPTLFNAAFEITTAAAKGKPVIVTETGWPVAGKDAESGSATGSASGSVSGSVTGSATASATGTTLVQLRIWFGIRNWCVCYHWYCLRPKLYFHHLDHNQRRRPDEGFLIHWTRRCRCCFDCFRIDGIRISGIQAGYLLGTYRRVDGLYNKRLGACMDMGHIHGAF